MANITNNFAEGSCVFQAGSTMNGDVIINGLIYQYGTDKVQDNKEPKMSKEKRICQAVDCLYNEGLVNHKYYLAAIRQILLEHGEYDTLEYKAFTEMLNKGCATFKNDLPSEDSISKVIIKGSYPNWTIDDKKPVDCMNINKMVEQFLKMMK